MIFLVVREEDTHLQSPFTQPLSASMMILKEKQSKEKAHPPGTSKILAKARKKAMEEEKKVCCSYIKKIFSLLCIWKKSDNDLHFPIINVCKLLYLKHVYSMKMINAAYHFLCRVTKKLHPMKKKKTRAKKHGDRARSLRSN